MMKKILKLLNAWLPPMTIMIVIFYLSSRQHISVSDEFTVNFFVFKSLHIFEYAVLTVSFFRALYMTVSSTYKHALVIATVCALVYAGFDEFHQTFVPTRTGQIRDVFIDGIGIGLMSYYLHSHPSTRFVKNLLSSTHF